jgi:hypothetical protein
MNTMRFSTISGGLIGLAALGAYGAYRYVKYRRAKVTNTAKADECGEANIAI